MRVRAVLFDLDGTLLDTLEDLADSMNAVLERLHLPPHPVDAYRLFVGDGIDVLVRRALPAERRDDATVAWGVRAAREEYATRWDAKSRPYPGVAKMLDGLAQRELAVGILSNKPDDFTRKTTEALLSAWKFDLVWGVRDGVAKKPDPAGARAAADTLGASPAETVFCGDTSTDMKTAVHAGMFPIGVLWGFRDEAELRANGAKIILTEPRELLDHV